MNLIKPSPHPHPYRYRANPQGKVQSMANSLKVSLSPEAEKAYFDLREAILDRWNRSGDPSMAAIVTLALQSFAEEVKNDPNAIVNALNEFRSTKWPIAPTDDVKELAKTYHEVVTNTALSANTKKVEG